MPKIRVMIVDDIAETREQLRKLMSFDPDIDVVSMVGSGEEALKEAPKAQPDVVIMDINLPGMDGIAAAGKLNEIQPGVQIIMLSVQSDMDYVRRAMTAGARDFLTKPPRADELMDTIHRVYKQRQRLGPVGPVPQAAAAGAAGVAPQAKVKKGKIITFFSPKGGVGCTTLAVNTAIALHGIEPDAKILLVDGNLQFGDAAIFLKLQTSRTIVDLAERVAELDGDLLNSIVLPHPSGIKLLAAPPAPEEAEILRADGVEDTGACKRMKAVLSFVCREYDYIFLDTSHVVDDIMLAAIDLSDLVIAITRPVIPEIRGCRLFFELLQKMNFPNDKRALAINGIDFKLTGIQPEAIEKALFPAMARIPMDQRTAFQAANYGVPVMVQAPRSPMGLAFTAFAQAIRDYFTIQPVEETSSAQKRVGPSRAL